MEHLSTVILLVRILDERVGKYTVGLFDLYYRVYRLSTPKVLASVGTETTVLFVH